MSCTENKAKFFTYVTIFLHEDCAQNIYKSKVILFVVTVKSIQARLILNWICTSCIINCSDL